MNIKKAEELTGAYKYVFNSREGRAALLDLKIMAGIEPDPEQLKLWEDSSIIGSQMTHAEYAYRAGQQDMARYIEAMISEK